jgi:dTDP-4-amino-4,6-dideoxygalactose transaminase
LIERPIAFFVPSISAAERELVLEVLDSGWLTSGPKARSFEAAFAERVGGTYAVAVNSATAAMHLALAAGGVGEGDEVIVPTLTFTATAEVVVHVGARPVLVDVEPDTLCVSPEAVAAAVTTRTRAVMPLHYGGQACDLDAVRAAVGSSALVLADAAHAFPTAFGDRMIGGDGIADASAFSFYANKTITTGEGGMLTTDDGELAAQARRLSLHGLSGDAWRRSELLAPWDYDVLAPGFKNNLSDIAAALGLAQLDRADELTDRRRAVAGRYGAAFAGHDLVRPITVKRPEDSAWHLYPVRLNLERLDCDRNQLVAELGAAGIGTSVHYRPLHMHTFYREAYGYRRDDFPVAADAFDRLVSLPIYPDLAPADVDRVVDVLNGVLETHRR